MGFFRSLGEIVGLILRPIDDGRHKPQRVVKEHVEESTRDTPGGTVRLRRTIIEEIEFPPGTARPHSPTHDANDRPSTS